MAEIIGVSIRSVYRWQQHQKSPPKKIERDPGRPSRLTEEQIQQLEQELLRGRMPMDMLKIIGPWSGSIT